MTARAMKGRPPGSKMDMSSTPRLKLSGDFNGSEIRLARRRSTMNRWATGRVSTSAALQRVSRAKPVRMTCMHVLPRHLDLDYEVDHQRALGSGKSGSVYLGRDRLSRRKVAVKTLPLRGIAAEEQEEVVAELEVFLQVDHPHVMRLLDVYQSSLDLHLVMECMSGGDLAARAEATLPQTPEETARTLAKQMLLAVSYLHGRDIVHRDLKLDNFLYERPDSDYVKLADFGLSVILENCEKKPSDVSGTLMYMAPEVLQDDYEHPCDVWSYAVCVFALLFGYLPFNDVEEWSLDIPSKVVRKYGTWQHFQRKAMERICSGRYHVHGPRWEATSPEARDFVRALLVRDVRLRPTALQALEDKWLTPPQADYGYPVSGRETSWQLTAEREAALLHALRAFAKMEPMERACLMVMALGLAQHEEARIRGMFLDFADGTGLIAPRHLEQFFQRRGVNDDEASELFRAMDVSDDGFVAYSEFAAALLSTRAFLSADREHLLRRAFFAIDTDQTGLASPEAIGLMVGHGFGDIDVDAFLDRADLDNDGLLSFADFKACILKATATGKPLPRDGFDSPPPSPRLDQCALQ